MGSRNLARLGVVLGLDTAEWEADINQAISANKKLSREIKADSNAAEKEILRLKFATEDYGKTLTQVQIIQRGIDSGRYANATKSHTAELLRQAKAYDDLTRSSAKAGFAMNEQQKIQLAYQTTDLVTQIVSGGNPLIAMMQQGGQLKDAMGGIGNMFRSIGTLFTPISVGATLVASAFAFLGAAAYKGAQDLAALRDALILTNNIAGLSEAKFYSLSRSISDLTKVTIGEAKDALLQLAKSGMFTAESIQDVSRVIGIYGKIAGLSGKEAAEALMPSLDGSASSAAKLNSQFHFLTIEQYKHIEVLSKQGKVQESIAYTANLLNQSFSNQKRELGELDSAYESAKNKWSAFWNATKEYFGSKRTPEQEIQELQKFIANPPKGYGGRLVDTSPQQRRLALLLSQQKTADEKLTKQASVAAKNTVDIENFIFAGGREKQLALSYEISKSVYQDDADLAKLYANDIGRIEIDALLKSNAEKINTKKKNEAERNVFSEQNQLLLDRKLIAIERDKQKQIRQIQLNGYILQAQDAETFQSEAEQAYYEHLNRNQEQLGAIRSSMRVSAISGDADASKLNMKIKMIGATDKELQLATLQIDKERELSLLKESSLTPAMFALRQQEINDAYRRKQGIAELTEQLVYAGQINDAIFGNMNKYLEDFVRTGKLSFKDFTKSVIQDLLLVQLKMQATFLLKQALGSVGSFFGVNLGSFGGGKAEGGPVQSGATYLVGENGPEIFTTQSSGTIIPNHALSGGGGGQTVNYNGPFIQSMSAIDTQSGIAFLAKNKQAVWAANQSAQRSLPASR